MGYGAGSGTGITSSPDVRYWSASEAALILAPHLTPRQVRAAIRRAGITPVPGARRHSRSLRGTLAEVYPADDLIRLLGG